jgi:hypothetical protein
MSVLRLMPKVWQNRGLGRAAVERHHHCRQLFAVDRDRAPTSSAAAPGRCEACPNPLLDQGPLELRQGTEDMEQEFALRRGGVHLFGERPKRDPTFLEAVYCREQVGKRSAETVKLPYHKAVVRSEERQSLCQAGALPRLPLA